jgi:hypothetical protein
VRTLLLILVVLGSAADARPAPRRVPPPFDRNCRRLESSEKLAACIATHAKGATVAMLAPDLERVRTPEGREYLFVRFGARWEVVYRPGDADYELVGRSELTVGAESARRIDLGHHIALGNTGVFFERISLICSAQRCSVFTTACTVVQRGRATETYRGILRVSPEGAVSVDGDRTHATSICRGR